MEIHRQLILPDDKNFFLFGPRQTGKSTLLKSLFDSPECLYYDLLRSEVNRKYLANPEIFRSEVETAVEAKKIRHVIIDEVQKIPALLDEVHSLITSGIKCNFILSGSSARKLKRAHANMLAGRAWTFRLYPFNYFEIKDNFNLNEILRFGSLPSVYLARDTEEKGEILRSYVDTYLKEEIEIEAGIRNLGGFLRFLSIAAAQNGEITNYMNIARETGVKNTAVKEYYKILEDTLIGFFLLPFARSIRKKMTRHPKFYFFDTGVVSAVNKRLNVRLIEGDFEYGRCFEHFMICELLRLNEYKRADLQFSFYRTENGAEVDLIIEFPAGKIIAMEIKSTANPSSSLMSGLRSFKEKAADAELILACRADRARRHNDVTIMPWPEALEYIASLA